ncbi:uncharacterized protein LOC128519295 isoform X2 [Clarias gariepinus]|nr:uncharacterized protein LOC128519295 isoform X2 [Clarias gariepinus]
MSSQSLLMVLLVFACLQSFTMAQHSFYTGLHGRETCCFRFMRIRISSRTITDYRKTERGCTKPGIIFTSRNGRHYCADPEVQWVKKIMDKIDQRLLKSLTSHDSGRPGPCCFSFQKNEINVDDINFYKITHSTCSNAGIHFIMKNGHHVCANPKDHWVKDNMDAIDHRHVANLMQSQHLN